MAYAILFLDESKEGLLSASLNWSYFFIPLCYYLLIYPSNYRIFEGRLCGLKGEGDSEGLKICKYIGYKMKIFITGYRKKIIVLSIFDRQNT